MLKLKISEPLTTQIFFTYAGTHCKWLNSFWLWGPLDAYNSATRMMYEDIWEKSQ